MLVGWLEWQQRTVKLKCDGLSETDARRVLLATSPDVTIAGLVGHLTSVERDWLEGSFLGSPELLGADNRGGWRVEDQTLTELLAEYDRQTMRSQEILAEHDLDELEAYAPPDVDVVSLRWILTHLIEETGRHLGHLDILRELTDGLGGQ